MSQFIEKNRIAVLCGVIASLIVIYALEPLLNFTAQILLYVAGLIGGSFLDHLYAYSARMESTDFAFFLTVLILTPASFFCIVFLIRGPWGIIKRTVDLKKTPTNSAKKPIAVQDKNRRWPRSLIFKHTFDVVFRLLCLFFLILTIYSITMRQFQWMMVTKFRWQVRILRPYIDDKTEHILVSDWAQMKTQEDYRAITEQLLSIAGDNDIELP